MAASDLGDRGLIVPLCRTWKKRSYPQGLLRYGRGEGKLKAAQALGLSKATLYRKIKEYSAGAKIAPTTGWASSHMSFRL